MLYWVKFNCDMCAEAGSYQGWCLCRKSVVGDPTVKTSRDGYKYTEGEIQMWPIFQSVIDPWHYKKSYSIFNPLIIKEILALIKK